MTPSPAPRLVQLDVIRGACLVTIALNHYSNFAGKLGYAGHRIWTPTQLGYSSAAELFILISGYLVGHVHARQAQPWTSLYVRLTRRALLLYLYNALALLCLLVLAARLDASALDAMRLRMLATDPADAVARFLVLRWSPQLLDILQLYILFLLVSIVFVPVARRFRAVSACLVIALYVATQIAPLRAACGLEIADWDFDPFAWQLLFFSGTLLACGDGADRFDRALRSPRFVAVSLGALALLTLFFIADRKLSLTAPGLWDKQHLGVLRVAHAALVLVAFWWGVGLLRGAFARFGGARLASTVATLGRHSLEVFVIGAGCSYLGAIALRASGMTAPHYFAIAAGIVVLLFAFAQSLHWRAGIGRREAQEDPGGNGGTAVPPAPVTGSR